jgi:excisionase family DNA binding protein
MFGEAHREARRSQERSRAAGWGVLADWIRPPTDTATRMDDEVENMQPRDDDALLTPSEVAAMFRVNPKTVTRWARAGKISAIRTLGGHRRFRASEIRQFLEQVEQTDHL